MPLAGLGYFVVFLFVQKGASDLLKQTLRIPIDWIRGVCCGYDPSQAQESEKAASKDGSNPPNISDSSATATSIADSNNLRERSWTDETVDFSSQLEYVRNQRTVIDMNQGSAERIERSDRMSYTYSDEESGSGSPKSTQHKEHSNSDESVSGNRQDWSYRDSTASATNYFEERISTFRSVSECTGVTVAKQLSTLKHINEEDVDELLEDELIELIEFTGRKSEKAVKAIRIGKEVNPIHIGKTDKK
jgi:hypothetical protein